VAVVAPHSQQAFREEPRWAAIGPAVVVATGLGALLLYLRTFAPALPPGDSGEFITAAWVLGVPHPPGYPLYTLLAHLAQSLPLGSPALRVNLLSALLGAGAVTATALLLWRLLEPRARGAGRAGRADAAVGAAVGALLLGVSPAFWSYALVAEVFALNALFAALLLLGALAWADRPRAAVLGALGLGCGLAATHHHTIALLAPALLLLMVWGARRAGTWVVRPVHATAAGLLVLGLLPYLYLPFAASHDPPWIWGKPGTLEGFLRVVTRADYGSFRLAAEGQPSGSPVEQLVLLGRYLYMGFTPVGCLLTGLGAWWLARQRPVAGLALLLAFLASGPAFVAYANPNTNNPLWRGALERFYILPSLPFAVAAGAGAFQLLAWARRPRLPTVIARYASALVGVALLALPLGSAATHFASVDQTDNFVTRNFGEDILAPIEPGALLLTRGDAVTSSVAYQQLVEALRPDVVAVDLELLRLPWYAQQVRDRHPDVVVPFEAYDPTLAGELKRLVEANLASRPVFAFVGPLQERDFGSGFDFLRAGFASKITPKTPVVADPFAILRQKLDLFAGLRYPSRSYRETSFEYAIAHDYGRLAFDVANALREAGRANEAIATYKTAIRLAPDYPLSYKNLGLLLLVQGGSPSETADLWEEYLRLNPSEPQAAEMRRQVDRIRGRAP
jgi:tetratricopeptide (TPR) repeat protein